jgi:glutamate/tyrosine decarboxylase-like PLP-dependent enzyme
MDYAFHLTRRPRGLPFWFSLAVHGTDAYSAAVEHVLQLTHDLAAIVRRTAGLDLAAEPELSTLLLRRPGWRTADYEEWADKLMAEKRAFVQPTHWKGEAVMRLCLVNPQTRPDMLTALIDDLACFIPTRNCVAAS